MSAASSGLDLIKSLKRGSSHRLPPYEEEKVRRCIEEMKVLFDENRRDVAILRPPSQGASSADDSTVGGNENLIQAVLIRHATMERLKRCLLAYHHTRLMQIKELRWQYGAVIPKGTPIQIVKHIFLYFK